MVGFSHKSTEVKKGSPKDIQEQILNPKDCISINKKLLRKNLIFAGGNWVQKNMSLARIINALNSAKATGLQDDYYRLQENSDTRVLNNLLEYDWQKG